MINERDIHKRTPIFYAVFFRNYELISILLEHGADTLFSDVKGRTILHYASIIGA
jgi:ankyrin repeat protein